MGLGWVGNFAEKTIYMTFDRSSLNLNWSSQADLHSKSCRALDSNFTYKHTLSKSKTKTKTCFDHGLPILHIRVLNTLVPKSLEPNILEDCLYVPNIRRNLISTTYLGKHGYCVILKTML